MIMSNSDPSALQRRSVVSCRSLPAARLRLRIGKRRGSRRAALAAALVLIAACPTSANTDDRPQNASTGTEQHETILVSRASGTDGIKGDAHSLLPSISADGRFVAFQSVASNLHPDAEIGGIQNVFVRDLETHDTMLVSRASGAGGVPGNGHSMRPSISADGRFVAFESRSSNLHPDDTDVATSVYVRDLQADVTVLVSRASGESGDAADGGSTRPSISGDGRYIAFESIATNLHPDDTDGILDVFVRDLQSHGTLLVSRATGSDGVKGDDASRSPALSADGRFVAFHSPSTNLHSDAVDESDDIYVRDVQDQVTLLASRAEGVEGHEGNGRSTTASISADGRYVAFTSQATNLHDDDADNTPDIYVRDLHTHTIMLASRAGGAIGAKGNGVSREPEVSNDGRYVAFESVATNLHPDDADSTLDVFMRDLVTHEMYLASRATGVAGQKANDAAQAAVISGDGRLIGFWSTATNLHPDDSDSIRDVYVRDKLGLSAESRLQFAPDALDLGDVGLGNTSSPQQAVLHNVGDATVTGLVFDGVTADFDLDAGACGTELDAGESCEVVVTFTPVVVGPSVAEVEVVSAEGDTATLSLLGNGVESEVPELSFSPSSLDFGDVPVGTTSPPQTATLQNTGDADATGLAFTVPGSDFAADTSNCGATLPASESCTVVVTFTPPGIGSADATLMANSDQAASASLDLLGTGLESGSPELSFDPPSLDFGDVPVGTTSPPQTATLQNTGDADATGLLFTVPGSDFAADTSNCGATLPASESCTVVVTFTPPGTGSANATLMANSEQAASASLDLLGTGLESGSPELSFDPPSLDFGDVPVGTSSAAQTAMLRNTGDGDATGLAFATSDGGFVADTSACGDVLPADQGCVVSVTFTPAFAGPADAALEVSSDEGASARLGTQEAGAKGSMEIASYWGGPIFGGDVNGDYAYLANGAVLRVVDISDESQPVSVAALPIEEIADVKVRDGHAFVAARCFTVVDISNPYQPQVVWEGSCGSRFWSLEIEGDLAYVGGRTDSPGMQRWNIQDPANPQSAGTLSLRSFTVHGGHVYGFREGERTLEVYNAGTLQAAGMADILQAGGEMRWGSLAASGNYLYMAVHWRFGACQFYVCQSLFTIDVSNPDNPSLANEQPFAHAGGGWLVLSSGPDSKIQTAGGRLFVGLQARTPAQWTSDLGLGIFDVIADPATPSLVSTYMSHGSVYGVIDATENRAYVADASEGLLILDVSQPAESQRLGKLHSPADLRQVILRGHHLYASDKWGGFTVLDIANITMPRVLGSYLAEHYDGRGIDAFGIDYNSGKIYLGAGYSGMEVVDVGNPAAPLLLGAYRIPFPEAYRCSRLWGVAIADDVAHAGVQRFPCGGGGESHWLFNIGVEESADLQLLGSLHLSGGVEPAESLAHRHDGTVFVGKRSATGGGGQQFVDASVPASPTIIFSANGLFANVAFDKQRDLLYTLREAGNLAGSSVVVQDVNNPGNPLHLGDIGGQDLEAASYCGRDSIDVMAADFVGGRGYLLDYNNRVFYLDVSDPAAPMCLDSFALPRAPAGGGNSASWPAAQVMASGSRLFITGEQRGARRGLAILEVSGTEPVPNEAMLALSGVGVEAVLSVAPNAVSFGAIAIGDVSGPESVTLTSVGNLDVEVSGISGAEAPFERTSGTCPDAPFELERGTSCTLDYSFTPTAVAEFEATVTIESNADPVSFTLAGEGVPVPPQIAVAPESLGFTVPAGGGDSGELTITNLGDETLLWQIDTAEPAGDVISTWREAADTPVTDAFSSGASSAAGRLVSETGKLLLGDLQMSQTNDTSIVPANSVECPTGPNHLLRRFYFAEHPGVGNPATISSVDVAIQQAVASQTLTVNLYTLPSGTPVDTIPLGSLTPIGSGSVTISLANDFSIVNVPVAATVGNTGIFDLVVEATVAGNFFIGATDTGETHPGFVMAPVCGAAVPTPIGTLGPDFEDTHIILVVNAGAGEPTACDDPATIPWLSVDPDAGSTGEGDTDFVAVMVDAADLAPGGHEAVLCVTSNDPDTPLVQVPVSLTVEPVPAPELAFHPAQLDFGEVSVGTTSAPQTATLTNSGTLEATGLTFDLPEGAFAADTSACGATLPAGGSCAVDVTFTPTEAGPATASLEVTSAGEATASLPLSGSGTGDPAFTPVALAVDPVERVSDGNSVFEPDELVDVMPSWRNDGNLGTSLTGTASELSGPDGAIYSLAQDHADYGLIEPAATASCLDLDLCYRLGVNDPAARPATHWMATFDETLSEDTTKTWSLHIGESFADVPRGNIFYPFVETLLHHGVTGGCTAAEYCPTASNTRGQMAVFLLKAVEEDPDYAPPACVEGGERFADVPFDNTFCSWIEELAERGITSGCGGGNYCPDDTVTRGQMAVFLLKAFEGDGYTPPECSEEFSDVTCPSAFAAWIEELAERGVTGGCTADPPAYCPADPVTRQQMAVFVTKTFGLTLYGP